MKRASRMTRMFASGSFRLASRLRGPTAGCLYQKPCLGISVIVHHSPSDGHLHCSRVLLLTDKASVSRWAQASGWAYLFFLGDCVGMRLLGIGCGCACERCPHSPQSDCLPTSRFWKGRLLPACWSYSPSERCVALTADSACLALMRAASIFALICRPHVFVGDASGNTFCPFCWVVCFLVLDLGGFFVYSGYQWFIRYMLCKYFLLVFGFSFHSIQVLSKSDSVSYGWNLVHPCVFFYGSCFWCLISETFA